MPAKNSIRLFEENSFYHVYNRGVNKSVIYKEEQDYSVFLSYIKYYLSFQDPLNSYKSKLTNNFYKDVSLISYCLMPNHFHLLLHQVGKQSISGFLQSMNVKYVKYFNTKYSRVGSLYQGKYKAVKIDSNEQLIYLTKYIHLNPVGKPLTSGSDPEVYAYSSYKNYLGLIHQTWIDPTPALEIFDNFYSGSYKNYIESDDSIVDENICLDVPTSGSDPEVV